MKIQASRLLALQIVIFLASGCSFAQDVAVDSLLPRKPETARDLITIRTETYPRPPYSTATYYIYERAGAAICTKLTVCDKFDSCESEYVSGGFKTAEDSATGKPGRQGAAVSIRRENLSKHMCLTKFVLLKN